jgi:hypothetical protein
LRFVGKSRLGFCPLPLSEAERIRKFLMFPDSSSALDPCVGDGVAFEAVTSGAEVLCYGIELDAYRAEQARERIPNIVQGNMLEVHCAVECFSLLYLNPPYDWALGPADSRRTEQTFLSHTYRWLKAGGVRGPHVRDFALGKRISDRECARDHHSTGSADPGRGDATRDVRDVI